MKRLAYTGIASAALLATQVASALPGIQIDPDGIVGGANFFDSGTLSNQTATTMFRGCGVGTTGPGAGGIATATACTIYSATATNLINAPGFLTWAFEIPVLMFQDPASSGGGLTVGAGGGSTFDFINDISRTGSFVLHYSPTGTLPSALTVGSILDLGTGISDLVGLYNGGLFDSTALTQIAAGSIRLSTAFDGGGLQTFFVSGTDLALSNVDMTTIRTTSYSGSFSADVRITSQNAWGGLSHIVNDLVGTVLDIDVELLDLNTAAPFTSGVRQANVVVGAAPVFGLAGAPSTVRNDMTCGAPGTCDFYVQQTGAIKFNAEFVPEPGTLALLGLGLGAAGLRSRRKKTA